MWFNSGGNRVRESLANAMAWCDSCCLVTDAAATALAGDTFWRQVEQHAGKVRAAILSNLAAADTALLKVLHDSGSLRSFGAGRGLTGHFLWFERGDELRFFLAPQALCSSTVNGPGLWLFWTGTKAALPDGLQAILDDCWSSSLSAAASELRIAQAAAVDAITPTYSRPIPAVREALGTRSTTSFSDLEEDDQARALWSTLIGEGAVDLDRAIRLCAERLRAQGLVEYHLLRHEGRLYRCISERLLAARRSTELFDRPGSGLVRATQTTVDELTAEQWRDCVMGALEQGTRVDRDQAVRLGFAHAQTVYGVSAQRLRAGGRADQALRSAINSSIRQGYLAREGAAYLVRMAEQAEPSLRGMLPSSSPDPLTPEDSSADVETPAIEPELRESAEEATPPKEAVQNEPPHHHVTLVEPLSDERSSPTPDFTARVLATASTAAASNEAPSPLDHNLWQLDLPTRTLNWAERQGIQTVRQLVAWLPETFAIERNVGRRTVRETRERLEAHLGCSWEEGRLAARSGTPAVALETAQTDEEAVDSATEALTAGGSTGWTAVATSLTDEQRALPLLEVPLPTRMKNFVRSQGLLLLGELFRRSYTTLAAQENIGRKSLNDTLDAVRDFLSERGSPTVYPTFRDAWQAQLSALEPIPRMIVTRRAGMHGTRETLEELGGMLGVSRERVRQIEAHVLERVRERTSWRRSFEANVTAAFGAGRAVPLHLLAQDPWWAGIDQEELLLEYVVRRVFEDELFVLQAPSGKRYLSKFPQSELDERLDRAKERFAHLDYPVEMSVVDAILRAEADALDPVLLAELELAFASLLHVDPDKPGLALGYGRYRDDEFLAFLNGQDAPVPVAVIEERFGRGRPPEEVLYFKRGLVGLKRHFPDFDAWMDRLVPAALDVMAELPAGRQWLVPEIHDALCERKLVPEWLGHWHLASLMRVSGKVDYLGRLRVASKEGGQEQRLLYEELLEQLLQEAGGPLDLAELTSRVRRQTDIKDASANLLTMTTPFVRVDEHRVGLVARDIPGGPMAVAAAIEVVMQKLNASERGLTPFQAARLVNALSDVHATWSQQLVTSVLRNETTLRIDRSKNIGLDAWDDVRCPARAEFMRREVQKAGGTLPLSALNAAMEEVYGRVTERSALGMLAQQVGLTIAGGNISRPASVLPAPPLSRRIDLSGIPAEMREMFDELVREPLTDPFELRAAIQQHVLAIEHEYQVNEFVDVQGAHFLAQQCQLLLDRWDSLPLLERQLAHAAVRYFVSWQDVEHDFNIGGLDDDKEIMNAVLLHLGLKGTGDVACAS